jgi:hypothetical protein
MFTPTFQAFLVTNLILEKTLIFIRTLNITILRIAHAIAIAFKAAYVSTECLGVFAIFSLGLIQTLIAWEAGSITTCILRKSFSN